jgi:hypothetical protein
MLKQGLLALAVLLVTIGLAACGKSATSAGNGGSATTELNWDQGSWNQTNWQ